MASVYPLAKLVSAPDPAATVLYDFNIEDGSAPLRRCRVEQDGFSLGTPALQGDPDSIFPQYGSRTVSFSVQIRGPKSYALGKVSAAARWLLRDNSWLMVQLSSTMKPVWFKLYRPEPGDLSFDHVDKTDTKDVWRWSIQLPAEAFAYGQRITLASLTINNDPAAATNPCFAQIPAVVGDAPAPARIRVSHSNGQTGRRHLVSVTPAPATVTAPIVWQVGTGDGWTVGTDTQAPTSDSAYSGGSYRAVTFATPGMATRISGPAPVAVPPGRYKVMLRASRSDTSSTFQVRLGVSGGFAYAYRDTTSITWGTSAATGHSAWINLGDVRLPQGSPLLDVSAEQAVTPNVSLQAARTSGAGDLRLDAFMLIPIESDYARTVIVDWSSAAPSTPNLTREFIDGEIEAVYSRGSVDDRLTTLEAPGISGVFPALVPGENNVLTMLEQTSTSRATANFVSNPDCPDQLSTVKTVVISYQPRWLFIGDGS